MDNYHVLEMIGEGSFGKVYRGRRKYTGKVVALKFIPKLGRSEKDLENLRREIEIMRALHHENIIEMLDSFETEKEVVAVTDYAEGELFQVLEDDGNLPEEQVKVIACQLVSALYYLHAHRILHRDMKPQNILLGKGGVVKLCDFGFARAMSINTLVLTSIKGTPLYMAPELVEEKPYDHTADLWSLGCILYELFVGTPPFYTNSIFQLVSLIIKDPVRWPKNMSPEFKDFLQGLLTKNPSRRLSWPHLFQHPFVADGVRVSSALTNHLPEPFTEEPSAQQKAAKEKAARAKSTNVAAGTTIMRKLKTREQAENQAQDKQEAWAKKKDNKEPNGKDGVKPSSKSDEQWSNVKQAEPTPRGDRISHDYAQEFPDVEVESRKVLKKEGGKARKSIDQVKLQEEEADSEDEWDTLCDATDPESCDPAVAMEMLRDKAFVTRLATSLESTTKEVLQGMLEGASRLRLILRIISNLLALKGSVECLMEFCNSIGVPSKILDLLDQLKDTTAVKQQPWYVQILTDLVGIVTAYTVSELGVEMTLESAKDIMEASLRFSGLLPWLLNVKQDEHLTLRAQTLFCFIYQCETLDRSPPEFCYGFYNGLASTHADIVPALLGSLKEDEALLKKLEGDLQEGEDVGARWEQMCGMSIGALAELVFLPLGLDTCIEGKRKMATCMGAQMADPKHLELTNNFFTFLINPSFCENVLKAVYFSCQVSKELCEFLAQSKEHIPFLILILQGKVEIEDMFQNTVYEITLQTLSSIIITLGQIPPQLIEASVLFAAILLDSQVASQTTAAALLVSQLLYHGIAIEMPTADLLAALQSALTDLSQICVRCPFDYGVLDGLMLLLCQFLSVGENTVSRLLIETGVWQMLWNRIVQTLGVIEPESGLPIQDLEEDSEDGGQQAQDPSQPSCQPEWSLISPAGLMAGLQVITIVFTQEPYQCVPLLCNADGAVMLSLSTLISKDFLGILASSISDEQDLTSMVIDIVLHVCQLLCFPFAMDIHDMLLSAITNSLQQSLILPKLLEACRSFLKPEMLEVPVGLLSRLILSNDVFVSQFSDAIKQLKAESFVSAMLSPECPMSVQCDMLSICSHLARSSAHHLPMLKAILQGNKDNYECLSAVLNSKEVTVQARACGLVGNLLRHTDGFYSVLKGKEDLIQTLLLCLVSGETDVRKASSYCIGNAAYHNQELYESLAASIPDLVKLLNDPTARIRTNSAGALGNMARHSAKLVTPLVEAKVAESLLETACHDNQYNVQDVALISLRTMARHSQLKQALLKSNAIEKLAKLGDSIQHSDGDMSPGSLASARSGRNSASSVSHHCSRLIAMLRRSASAR